MYRSLSRRGVQPVAGVPARSEPAEAHRGRYAEFLSRHERESRNAVRAGGRVFEQIVDKALARIADTRNLFMALKEVQKGGRAPGPDGLRARDLSDQECWAMARMLQAAILEGAYVPGPDRPCPISKGPGRGWRELAVPNVVDRTAYRGILQMLRPLVEHQLPARVFGGATGRSHLDAIAAAERCANEGYTVWAVLDVADAFPSVPRSRLLDILRQMLPSEKVQELLETIIGTTGRGLRQGGALSPLCFDLYLAKVLDQPWERDRPNVRLLRYADDLLLAARTGPEVQEGLSAIRERLRTAGVPAKRSVSHCIPDLDRGEPCDWLGFQLRLEAGRLTADVPPKSWASLQESLDEAWETCDPMTHAAAAALGWVSQQGPALPEAKRGQICDEVVRRMRSSGFEETPRRNLLLGAAEQAHSRWEDLRENLVQGTDSTEAGGSAHRRNAISHSGGRLSASPALSLATPAGPSRPAVICVGVRQPGSPGWWAYRSLSGGLAERVDGRVADATPATLELTALLTALQRVPGDGWDVVLENPHLVRVLRCHTVHSMRLAVQLDRRPPLGTVPREVQLTVFQSLRLGVRVRTPNTDELPLIRQLKQFGREVLRVPRRSRWRSRRSG